MVVPCLRHHLQWHEQAEHADDGGEGHAVHLHALAQQVVECRHAHAAPNGEGVERAGVSIVALTGLHRRLVQVYHDGETCHEEEEEHHPELAYAATAAERLPEETDKAEDERQAIERVVSLVAAGVGHGVIGLQVLRQFRLVAQARVVDKRYAGNPVAMLQLAVALDVVLPTGEVPHEVAPVHEVALVREEELYVVYLRRHLHGHLLTAAVVRHVGAIHAAHPRLIVLGVAGVVHAREDHVLRVDVLVLVCHHEVGVLLVFRCLLLSAVDWRARLHDRRAHVTVLLQGHLRGVCLAVEQRVFTILVTAEVGAEGEDVLWRVLVHWRVGDGAYHDEGVRRIAYHQHEHAEQGGVLETGRDEIHRLLLHYLLAVEQEGDHGEHYHANDDRRPAIAVERYADEGEREQEGDVLSLFASRGEALVDGPDGAYHEAGYIYNESGVERQVQGVDEEQLKPSAHGHDARHHAIEHGGEDDETDAEGNERALHLHVGEPLVAIHQHDGGQAQEVEQVDADGQAGHVEYQHEPTVGVRLVGMVFPLEDDPEHHGGER